MANRAYTLSEDQQDMVVYMYDRGDPDTKVAKKFGITKQYVWQLWHKRTGKRKGFRKLSPEDMEELLRRYAAGDRTKVIAADLGIHQTRVSLVANQRGLRRHKPYIARRLDNVEYIRAAATNGFVINGTDC